MIAQLKPLQSQSYLTGYDLPPVPSRGTRVILIRHGRSTLNDQGRYQGSSDQGELTVKGIAASTAVGQYLASCPIDGIYVSPLKRAQKTAAALLPYLTTPTLRNIHVSGLLREIHLPGWEGQRYEDVRSRDPDAYRCWQETPDQFQLSSASRPFYPAQDVYQRAGQFWQTALPGHKGQTILVISHGSTNQALINTALKLPASQHHSLQQTHSGLTVLDFVTPDLAQLHILNLTLNSGIEADAVSRLPKLKAGKQGIRLLLLPCQADTAPAPALATLLSSEPIQAAVVQDQRDTTTQSKHACHQAAETVLHQNPETVILSVKRSHFWPQWQADIQNALKIQPPKTLTTLLAIAPPDSIQTFLNTFLKLPQDSHHLTLQPNTLSVIHYPSVHARPILQGMNLIAP